MPEPAPDAIAPLPRRMLGRRLLAARVRLREEALDRALAGGAAPWRSVELLLRAAQLSSPPAREQLAASIEGLLELAARGAHVPARVPIDRAEVLAARDDLAALADVLRRPAPVRVAGLASVGALLRRALAPRSEAAGRETMSDAALRCRRLLEAG